MRRLVPVIVGVIALALLSRGALLAADKTFSVPLAFLQTAATAILIDLPVAVTGHSAVHPVASDCEMHFAAHAATFTGTPAGIVLEPMNLCVEHPLTGMSSWVSWANQVVSVGTATARGVPRIWPEHLDTPDEPSNPQHAFELHPLTRLTVNSKVRNFESFVFAPDGFIGGVSDFTAGRILTLTHATVTAQNSQAAITFSFAGSVGHFTTAEIEVTTATATTGGHVLQGTVTVGDANAKPIRMVSVTGSPFDQAVATMVGHPVTALVLFAMNLRTLLDAATASHGQNVAVADPPELIVYGVRTPTAPGP